MKKVYTKLVFIFTVSAFISSCVSSSKYNELQAAYEKELIARDSLKKAYTSSISNNKQILSTLPKADSNSYLNSLIGNANWTIYSGAKVMNKSNSENKFVIKFDKSNQKVSGHNLKTNFGKIKPRKNNTQIIILSPQQSNPRSNNSTMGFLPKAPNPTTGDNQPKSIASEEEKSYAAKILPRDSKSTAYNQPTNNTDIKKEIESQSEKLNRILGEIKVAEERLRQLQATIRNIEKPNKGN